MDRLVEEFIAPVTLGTQKEHFSIVPVNKIKHPSLTFKNYGGNENYYFCVLPKRKWGRLLES